MFLPRIQILPIPLRQFLISCDKLRNLLNHPGHCRTYISDLSFIFPSLNLVLSPNLPLPVNSMVRELLGVNLIGLHSIPSQVCYLLYKRNSSVQSNPPLTLPDRFSGYLYLRRTKPVLVSSDRGCSSRLQRYGFLPHDVNQGSRFTKLIRAENFRMVDIEINA